MADSTAPTGAWSPTIALAITLLAATPIFLYYGLPKLLSLAGTALGWTLRKKTEGRKDHLITLMNADNKAFHEQHKSSNDSSLKESRTGSKGLEAGASELPQDANKDWDGIVGFFHPFWCVATPSYAPIASNCRQQRWWRWRARSLGGYSCRPEPMA